MSLKQGKVLKNECHHQIFSSLSGGEIEGQNVVKDSYPLHPAQLARTAKGCPRAEINRRTVLIRQY